MQRVRIGGLGAATGLFISKPGKDISSTDYADFLFHVGAGDKLPRPLLSGIVTSVQTITIAHNLGFVPLCFLSTTDQDNAPIANPMIDSANFTFSASAPGVPTAGTPYASGTFVAWSIWNAKLA